MDQERLAKLVRQRLGNLSQFGVTHIPRPAGQYVLDIAGQNPVDDLAEQAAGPNAAIASESSLSNKELGFQSGNQEPAQRTDGHREEVLAVSAKEVPAETEPVVTSVPYPDSMEISHRRRELDILSQQVSACQKCDELARCRTQTVFGVGNPGARLCFLGEGPGADEDRQGEPFVGAAGQLLDKIIAASKMRREDVYILNTVKCRPPGNRNPTDLELANCWPFAVRQLEILQPEFICCLGSVAARKLLNTKSSIGRLRQNFHQYRGSRVLVTYHPAYLLRNPSAKKPVWDDMKMLMQAMGI